MDMLILWIGVNLERRNQVFVAGLRPLSVLQQPHFLATQKHQKSSLSQPYDVTTPQSAVYNKDHLL